MARQLSFEIVVEKQRATDALRDVEASMKRVTDEAAKTGKATDEQAAKYNTLAKGAANLKSEIKGYSDQLKSTTTATTDAAKGTGLLSSAILKYASAAVIFTAVKATADWADRFEELSVQTGLSIRMLQKLDQVTRVNGTSIETLTRAFATMQDRVAGGDKSATRAFEKLGFSFEAFQKMSPDAQIENLAIAVMKIEDPMKRANVVTDLFGRTGVQLIPTLQAIAGGMDDITVASDANIHSIAKMSDAWEGLKTTGMTLLTTVVGPFLSQVNDATSSTATWGDKLSALARFALNLTNGLGEVVRLMKEYNGEVGKTPTIKPADLPGLFGTGPDTPESTDDFVKRTKDIADVVNAQIASEVAGRRTIAELAKEAAKAAKDAAEAADRAFTHMRDVARDSVTYAADWVQQFANNAANAQGGWGIPKGGFHSSIYWTDQQAGQINGLPGNIGQGYSPTTPTATGMNDPFGYGQLKPKPSAWRQRMMQLNGIQSQWNQQNFGSAEGWVNSVQGWGSALQDIHENGDPLAQATNIKGRGARAAAGAIKGAQVGGQFGGPYGAMGGAAIGALVGAFRNPAFEDVFKRIAKNFGAEVSDELAKRIATRAKDEFHNDRQAAEIRSLGDILGETGGVTSKNVASMTERLHDAFSMFQGGKFDKTQLQATLNESFGYFAAYYDKIGGLADKSFTDIIRLSRESGAESAAVSQYVGAQVSKAADGIDTYLENATVKSQSAASGLAASMVLMFDEVRKGPEGLKGAIEQIGPMILTLQDQMKAAGFEGSDAFKGMLSYVEAFKVDGVAQASTAVDGLNATLEGLHNSTLLNAESFTGLSRAMTDEIEAARQALIAQGQDGDNALRLNAKGLQTVWELQRQFGWAVDDSTQAMLDQAKAQGLIGEQFQDTNGQMLDALNRMADSLEGIAEKFGVIGKSATQAGKDIDDATRPRTVPVVFQYPDGETHNPWDENGKYGPGGANPNGYAMGGVVRARPRLAYAANGWMPRGTDTVPAMLTPGEGVLSRKGMRALGRLNDGGGIGGQVFNITVNANDAAGGRAAGSAFTDELRRRGVRLRGVA